MDPSKTDTPQPQAPPKPKLGNFIPFPFKSPGTWKKFKNKTRTKKDKRCAGQDHINQILVVRAQYAQEHKGVYPITKAEIYGAKRRELGFPTEAA